MNRIEELCKKIVIWGGESNTNLIAGSDVITQSIKLQEEYGELCKNLLKGKSVVDDIGDNLVVLIILSEQNGINFFSAIEDCGDAAPAEYSSVSNNKDICLLLNVFYARMQVRALTAHGVNLKEFDTDFSYRQILCDIYCCFLLLCRKLNLTIEQCLEHAYNEIKDREGVMYEGAFVKSTDPEYATIRAVLGARRVHLPE